MTLEAFLMKNNTQNVVENFPRPFSEKSKLGISQDQKSKVLYGLFLLYANLRAIDV